MALTSLYSINGTTSALEDKGLRDFISTASGSWTGGGGSEFPTTADNACKEVTAHSGNWNGVYTTVSNNSASWTGGGGGSSPVTSTGGTTTYINKLNDKNLSASVAYASPNGALLDNVYNSGRSGYAASAYIKNNVTANIGNWNAVYTAYTANSAQWIRPEWTEYDYYNQGLNYITANNVGAAGFKFNPGNLFSTYNLIQWTYSEIRLTQYVYAVRFGAAINNVVGTQWSQHTGVFTLSKGNFMEINEFNCGDGWNNTQISLIHDNSWSNSVRAILRDIRNTSTADNNTFTLYYTGMVGT